MINNLYNSMNQNIKIILLLIGMSAVLSLSPLHNEVMDFISAQPVKTQFKLWHYAFNKEYDLNSEVGVAKYATFKKNLQYIKEENNKNQGFTLGLGPFTDISFEEFTKYYLPEVPYYEENSTRKLSWFDDMVDLEENKVELKEEKVGQDNLVSPDWTSLYTYVKKQDVCGACWAFCTIGVIEGFIKKLYNQSIILSEQQLVDCSVSNQACKGGHPEKAFKYIREYGLIEEKNYPYKASKNICDYRKKEVKVRSTWSYCSAEGYRCEDEVLIAKLNNGPYASMMMAGETFMHYRYGQIAPERCNKLNHGVVVVNLNLKEGTVRFRNSYGPEWGEGGYGTLKIIEHTGFRGCGLLEFAFQPRNLVLS
jgi:C1A family cysteine protease